MKTTPRRFAVLVIALQLSTCSASPDGRSSSSPADGGEKAMEQPEDVAGGFGLYDAEVVCEPMPAEGSPESLFQLGCKVIDSANHVIKLPDSSPIELAFSTNAQVTKSEAAPPESQYQWIFTFDSAVESSDSPSAPSVEAAVEAEVVVKVRSKAGKPPFEGEIKAVFAVKPKQRIISKNRDVSFSSSVLSRDNSDSSSSPPRSNTNNSRARLQNNLVINCEGGANSVCESGSLVLNRCELFADAQLAIYSSSNCSGEPSQQLGARSAGKLQDVRIELSAFSQSKRAVFFEVNSGSERKCRRVTTIDRACFRD